MKNRLFVVMMFFLVVPGAVADVLDEHLWKDRLLILAAPSAKHPALQQKRDIINARRDAIDDRDLRIYELIGKQGLRDGEPLEVEEVAELRERFALDPNDRMVILVGLDGGEKRRAPLATPLSELFMQIDTMPMRRADIRAKKEAGEAVTKP